MSKVAITGNASGTGTLTIAAPNTNTDRTLTLPDNTGTILTNATTAGFPAGSVIQVVQATYATSTTIASTSYTDTGLSATITPTSTSSKILVLINQAGFLRLDTSTEQGGYVNLVRNSTQITESAAFQRLTASGTQYTPYFNGIVYLDSPNTTSSTAYKTQGKVVTTTNNGSIIFQGDNKTSTITLMEIAA